MSTSVVPSAILKCTVHPKRDALPGRVRCVDCVDIEKGRRQNAKANGKCPAHIYRDAAEGKTYCVECVDRNKKYQQNRKALGKCPIHPEHEVVNGKSRCLECFANNKEYRQELKANGKCLQHPSRDAVEGRARCQECLSYGVERFKEAKRIGKCPSHIDRDVAPGKVVCPECVDNGRWSKLFRTYGLTKNDYLDMYKAQNGKCACCFIEKLPLGAGSARDAARDFLVVDHCHKKGHVRALLCNRCNLVLGMCRDDPGIVCFVLAYMKTQGLT